MLIEVAVITDLTTAQRIKTIVHTNEPITDLRSINSTYSTTPKNNIYQKLTNSCKNKITLF